MVELFRERVPRAPVRVHDLAAPLDWLPGQCMDGGLFALALEYVTTGWRRWASATGWLRPGGTLAPAVWAGAGLQRAVGRVGGANGRGTPS